MNDFRAVLSGVFDRLSPVYDSVGVDFFSIFGRELVQDAALKPGDRVLDIGCGRGAVLFPVAEKVGAEGFVTGIDFASGMVEQTKRDAPSRAVHNVDDRASAECPLHACTPALVTRELPSLEELR